ncbi:MAG: hypothetical protein ACKVPJ_13555 [Chitinophagales bacterium]
MDYPVVLPIKPYLRKYLIYHYKKEPIKIGRDSFVGSYLMNLLQSKGDPAPDNWKVPSDKTLKFILGEWNFQRKGIYITSKNIAEFNNFVDGLFRMVVYESILDQYNQHLVNGYVKRGLFSSELRRHLDKYKITEDDLPFDTIDKDFYRFRKDIENSGYDCPFRFRTLPASLKKIKSGE